MTASRTVLAEQEGGALPPESLLPAQEQRRRPPMPEEVLAAAVLEDAIGRLRKYRCGRSGHEQRLFRQEEAWFLVERTDWPFSFERICAFLGLDPDCVRRAVGLRCRTHVVSRA